MIVETEAYSVRNDEACHTFFRPSSRAFVAGQPPGTAYVYLNYGVHWLLNFLVKGGPEDGFVLIRALEPTRGIPRMEVRRKTRVPTALCSGPGKLTRALGIDGSGHGLDFLRSDVLTLRRPEFIPDIESCPRVVISKSSYVPLRFVIMCNTHFCVPFRPRGLERC